MRGYFNWHVVIVGVTTMNINQALALASLECQLRPCHVLQTHVRYNKNLFYSQWWTQDSSPLTRALPCR